MHKIKNGRETCHCTLKHVLLISSLCFSDQCSVMAAGPWRQVLIMRAGLTFRTVWVQPRGKYNTSPGYIVKTIGVAFA